MSDQPVSAPPDSDRRLVIMALAAIGVLAVLLVGGVFVMATFKPAAPQSAAADASTLTAGPRSTRTAVPTRTAGPATDTPTPTSTITDTPIGTFTPLPTHTLPAPTATRGPTWTPVPIVGTLTPTSTPGPSPTPTIDQGGCNWNSTLVEDTTVPSGTTFEKNTAFTKTWRIQNNGCQSWQNNPNVTLQFVSGTQMGAPDSVDVDHTEPGKKVYVNVDMTAPATTGYYTSRWQLAAPDGTLFGQVFLVNIQVVPKQVTFDLTFDSLWQCSPKPNRFFYSFQVTNTSTLKLQSASWTLTAPKLNNSGSDDKPFQSVSSATNCNSSALNGDALAGGGSAWVSGYFDNKQAPSGKKATFSLTLCTLDGNGGTCSTKNISFTAP